MSGATIDASLWIMNFGVATLSPLGPLGVDVGYGFDKIDLQGRPAPGWKLHFKLGQFF